MESSSDDSYSDQSRFYDNDDNSDRSISSTEPFPDDDDNSDDSRPPAEPFSDEDDNSHHSSNCECEVCVLISLPPPEPSSPDEVDSMPISYANVDLPAGINIPGPGQPLDRRQCRKAGPYIIGATVYGYKPLPCIMHHIAKKEDTNTFYLLKILQLSQDPNLPEKHMKDEQAGKILIHTEYSLLSLLKNEPGVVKLHEMFSDLAYDELLVKGKTPTYTGGVSKRLIMVLDCVVESEFCAKTASYVNLQQHKLDAEELTEGEALFLLYEITKVVEKIHKSNIVHRDLNLGNIVINKFSKSVKLVNFGSGRHLPYENTLLYDQKGSPGYISPEVLSGKPYRGKPCDMWALGVIYFVLICGNLPFSQESKSDLFKQIKHRSYEIPNDVILSLNSYIIFQDLLNIDPYERLTASKFRQKLESMLAMGRLIGPDQIVPEQEVKYLISLKTCEDQIVPTFSKYSYFLLMKYKENIKKISKMHGFQHLDSEMQDPVVPKTSNAIDISGNGASSCQQLSPVDLYPPDEWNFILIMANEFTVGLNDYFLDGTLEMTDHAALREFDGLLSDHFVTSLFNWLTSNMGTVGIIEHVLLGNVGDRVTKIKNFFIAIDVKMGPYIYVPLVSRYQTDGVRCILTYLLNIAGYSNTYFEITMPE